GVFEAHLDDADGCELLDWILAKRESASRENESSRAVFSRR
ncbi:MAG: hypothetical protein RLZZ399_2494, partial [Verrucomicrobiota bacterium]